MTSLGRWIRKLLASIEFCLYPYQSPLSSSLTTFSSSSEVSSILSFFSNLTGDFASVPSSESSSSSFLLIFELFGKFIAAPPGVAPPAAVGVLKIASMEYGFLDLATNKSSASSGLFCDGVLGSWVVELGRFSSDCWDVEAANKVLKTYVIGWHSDLCLDFSFSLSWELKSMISNQMKQGLF